MIGLLTGTLTPVGQLTGVVERLSGGGGGGSVTYWSSIQNKPFESLDPQTLVVNDGVLAVNTTNDVENGGARPVTAAGVNVVVGNINVLLSQI